MFARRFMIVMTVALVCLVGPLSQALPVAAEPASDEAAFVAKINDLRASKGLGTLSVDSQLTGIARNWATSMANAGAISHNPNLASQVTEDWIKLGENVGVGGSVDALFDAFVASPSHYENLVDPAFTRIGVGVVYAGGRMYTSHEFMQLAHTSSPTTSTSSSVSPTSTSSKPAAPKRVAASAPPRATAIRTTTTTVYVAPVQAVAAATAAPVEVPLPPKPEPSYRILRSLEALRGSDQWL